MMKKGKWMATALLTATLLAAGCSAANGSYSGEGYVLEQNGDASYLIISEMTSDDVGKSWNELYEAGYRGNVIVLRVPGGADLIVGDKVKYWVDGEVNLSYPAQAKAKRIEKTGVLAQDY